MKDPIVTPIAGHCLPDARKVPIIRWQCPTCAFVIVCQNRMLQVLMVTSHMVDECGVKHVD